MTGVQPAVAVQLCSPCAPDPWIFEACAQADPATAAIAADQSLGATGAGVRRAEIVWAASLICCANHAASRHIQPNLDEAHSPEKRCKSAEHHEPEPNPGTAPDPPPKR